MINQSISLIQNKNNFGRPDSPNVPLCGVALNTQKNCKELKYRETALKQQSTYWGCKNSKF